MTLKVTSVRLALRFKQKLVVVLLLPLAGCGGGSMSPGSPAVTLSASSVAFPDEVVGAASPAQVITVTNSGRAPLNVTGVTVGADFQEIDDCSSQVGPGASCTINVTFVPTTTGDLHGTITVSDNASGSPQSITLAGQGVSLGPPPPATLIGYCFGQIQVAPNKCALVKDQTSCPVGKVAVQPQLIVSGCLPPSSQYVDTSTSCQGNTSTGLTVKGYCVVAE